MDFSSKMKTFAVVLFLFYVHRVISRGHPNNHCCSDIRGEAECKAACNQIKFANGLQEQVHVLAVITQRCPPAMTRLWGCLNDSYPILNQMDSWPGRVCCDLPQSPSCRRACRSASSANDLVSRCQSHNNERFFYSCIERQTKSEQCCSQTNNFQCRSACRAIFASDIMPTSTQREAVRDLCGQVSPPVVSCVNNYTHATPANNPTESLPCCDKAAEDTCRRRCRTALTSLTTEQEIVEELIATCGNPIPVDPMWQCFLANSGNSQPSNENTEVHTMDTTGIDSAKLQCCVKAKSRTCRQICINLYNRGWANSWNEFDENCQTVEESAMSECIAQVDEPCVIGCSGLSYCTNFNYRPSELFRSCSPLADMGAETDVHLWEGGVMPFMDASVADVRKCKPEVWKTIACSIHIKPCHSTSLATKICRSDCISTFEECVDPKSLPEGYSVESICDLLAGQISEPGMPCISLTPYLAESPHISHYSEVSHPCSPNPCNASQVCMINRKKCRHAGHCKPYTCRAGCPLGEASNTFVPRGTYVQIPVANNVQLNCHRICKCGHRGILDHCVDHGCLRPDSCLVNGQIYAHERHFSRGVCQQCVCYSKEIICTKRSCLSTQTPEEDRLLYTGLPCYCPDVFEPVCGVNGKTYGSSCLARCAGLSEDHYDIGTCHSTDPCTNNPCGPGRKCIPRRQVCLSTNVMDCRQHECVSQSLLCNPHHHDPVCDTDGEEHINICFLISENRQFAHSGHCLVGCKTSGLVCGVNGETYPNECTAWAERVAMDYTGSCQTVGKLNRDNQNSDCSNMECPPVLPVNCQAITPPGACCPICAAEIRVMYSKVLADGVSQAVHTGPITVQNVTEKLRQHIKVAECDIFGYLSIETDIVILIKAITANPTQLQVEACNTEAQKLSVLLKTRHPTILSDLILTPLIFSTESSIGTLSIPVIRTSPVVELQQETSGAEQTRMLMFIVMNSMAFLVALLIQY